ncbi:hypothetical protein D5018_01945 [Parashewanella curva]|uniref:Uncharacterized protein n=1 Tax=Parashewanella curva TaxID=2338552 RepID=A0A3L8Q1K9_9GAMM|nr:hypothetical protein D5018_01945 [Parashewanella curva]
MHVSIVEVEVDINSEGEDDVMLGVLDVGDEGGVVAVHCQSSTLVLEVVRVNRGDVIMECTKSTSLIR